MISLCLATRKRPEAFFKMCQSALDMAHNPDNIEFILRQDDDDKSDYKYIGNCKIIRKPKEDWSPKLINQCASAANGPIHMFLPDDIIFETKDWDKYVEDEFDKYEDKIVLICPDHKEWDRLGFGIVGFLHKNWINTVGHFLPEIDGGQSADRWLAKVAMKIRRSVRLKEMNISHENIRDNMHKIKNRSGREGMWTKKYHDPDMMRIRQEEANKLKAFIDGYKGKG